MLARIIEASIRNSWMVLLLFFGLAFWAWQSPGTSAGGSGGAGDLSALECDAVRT